MAKKFVLILGPHAVGKMTVGQQLAKITGLRLFHNHMSIELTRELFDSDREEWGILNETIRSEVFRLFAESDLEGLIFTCMCAFDMQEDIDYLKNILDLFKANGARCCTVELFADYDERVARNRSENRLLHKPSKRDIRWSDNEMRETSKKYRLNSYPGEELPFGDMLKLDNTNLSAEDAAKLIKEHFSL